jgi:hypothetical protein
MTRISLSLTRPMHLALALSLLWIPLGLEISANASAQEAVQGTEPTTVVAAIPVVPQQVRYAGKLATRAGDTVEAVFRIYASAEGGEPLWTETQKISIAEDGSYAVLLGSADPKGLPQTVFAGGAARWLGTSFEGGAEAERVMLASVPYAMKSADAEALAGHAASDFVTQEQLSALALQNGQANQTDKSTSPTPAFSPDASGPVTGSGTTGTIPLWTGAQTQGNSNLVQVGSDIGINETTPAAMLDVNGTEAVRGTLSLPTTATATTAKGYSSQPLQFGSSLWSTTAAAPVAQNFSLAAIPIGNDTATPSASLLFQYQSGTSAPAGILSIGSTGLISFATGQLFPGTITGALATAPLIAGVSGHNITMQLNETAMLATFNGTYAQLADSNSFTGSQSIKGGLSLTAGLTAQSSSVTGTSSATQGFKSNGAVVVTPATLATSSAAQNSPELQLGASVYSSSSAAAAAQTYAWQTQVSGNDTASPSSKLALLFSSGTASPAATGLSISSNGRINFASGQTFPITGGGGGTITGITTTSPLTGSGTSGSVALGLNESTLTSNIAPAMATALEPTFNSIYPQLASANSFTGNQAVAGTITSTVNAPSALGPILAVTNPGGGLNAAASVDFRTYLHTATAATPSARIEATDDNNYGNNLLFLSKQDGADGNGLQTNMEIPSTGGVTATGHTNASGVGAVGISALGGESTGSSDGADGGQLFAGSAAGSGSGGSGVMAVGGESATGSGGPGGYFYGGDTSGSISEATIPIAGTGATFQGGSAPSSIPGDGIFVTPGSSSGTDSTATAGVFEGDVYLSGTLFASAKDFKIDHPMDPANKYLLHTSVESSEEMNIYTGNVVTDKLGIAVIKLPDWFQTLNTDFRYQLTVIGQFAQAIVSREIENNQFTISTNATFVKVSWQVTGVRQDPYAKAHPLVVEQQKPVNERGFYIHPELYGQPEEKQTEWGRHPQMMRKLKANRQQASIHPQAPPQPSLKTQPAK